MSSDVEHEIVVSTKVGSYPVPAGGKKLKHYHDTLFLDDSKQPLCDEIRRQSGNTTEVRGCQNAAAFTVWDIKVSQPDLYDAGTGRKQPLRVEVTSSVTLPHWNEISSASQEEQAEARRADLRTAYHEAGHRSTPEAIARAIVAFANQMPSQVPLDKVEAMNAAANAVIHDFYIAAGSRADKLYDKSTGHGMLQGAEYMPEPITDLAQEETVAPRGATLVAARVAKQHHSEHDSHHSPVITTHRAGAGAGSGAGAGVGAQHARTSPHADHALHHRIAALRL